MEQKYEIHVLGRAKTNCSFCHKKGSSIKTEDRMEYIHKGMHYSNSCVLAIFYFLHSHLFMHPAALHFKKSAVSFRWGCPLKSPGFIQCWPRCLNLNVANTSQSQRTCNSILISCLHLLHLGLSVSLGDSALSAFPSLFLMDFGSNLVIP